MRARRAMVVATGAAGILAVFMVSCGPASSSRYSDDDIGGNADAPLPNGSACVGDPDSPDRQTCTVWTCANVPVGLEKKTRCTGRRAEGSKAADVKESEYLCPSGTTMNNRCPGAGYSCTAGPELITCLSVSTIGSTPNPASGLGDCATPAYRFIDETLGRGTSRIVDGPGGASMVASCSDSSCPTGQVIVEIPAMWEALFTRDEDPSDLDDVFAGSSDDGALKRYCVAAPPSCRAGTFPGYQPPFTDFETSTIRGGGWLCRPPCEIVIEYAGLYGNRRVCAERPNITCPGAQAPFFDPESERWSCRPVVDEGSCDVNSYWDAETYGDRTLCIPC